MKENLRKIDILIYFTSFISLILIVLLLSSSRSISYEIDVYSNNSTENTKELKKELREEIFTRLEILNNITNVDEITKINNKERETNIVPIHSRKVSQSLDREKSIRKIVSKRARKRRVIYHIVRKGECLWNISKKYNISMESLIELNNIQNPHLIPVGMRLKIILEDKIRSNNKIKSKKYITYQRQNIKRKRIDYLRKKRLRFRWPLIGRVTSEFGVRRSPSSRRMEFHTGIDIAARAGKKFVAAEDGKVIFVGRKGGYGLTIIIQHAKGYKTLYAHSLVALVRKGQYVKKGQVIGRIGTTGVTTGPHLHFEIRKNEVAIDPATLINKRKLFY